MKIRNGFVSNSSSSSFICEVSGRMETGYDGSLIYAEMFECINGHTVGNEFRLEATVDEERTPNALREILELAKADFEVALVYYNTLTDGAYDYYDRQGGEIKKDLRNIIGIASDESFDAAVDALNDILEGIDEDVGNVPESQCPICQLVKFRDEDILAYLIKASGATRAQIENAIRGKFGTDYMAFRKSIEA